MHLSRLRLDPRSQEARRDLANPYEMHRTLTRCFVNDSGALPPRFLWRSEPVIDWHEAVILVQSETLPSWDALTSRDRYLRGVPESKVLIPEQQLRHATDYRFRLFGNTTVTRDGKRYGLVSEDAQLAWLARQGEKSGFSVLAALVMSSDVLRARKENMPISLRRACFEGRLRVTDAVLLAGAMKRGIGPAKAFGFGLLSLAP
ncbi:type I-E CRISPR-associated protein Cas6/Cse3/CasE [Pigmentiphaga sp.]|uniref:type I-E CRISPR-associated protein Cas6/Cse3/CasE n=1 Tax=Pigmentiphaga sp. TaxID=1977564 RepID=UPI0039B93333